VAIGGHLDARTETHVEDVLDAIEVHVPIVEAYLVGSGSVGSVDPRTNDVDLEHGEWISKAAASA